MAISKDIIAASDPVSQKVVKSITYTNDVVSVVYQGSNGQTENAEYSFAIFIVRIIGDTTDPGTAPALYWTGKIGPTWLECTKALQYYEQEKAKDVARELQNWVFGPATPRPHAGVGQKAKKQTSCKAGEHLDGSGNCQPDKKNKKTSTPSGSTTPNGSRTTNTGTEIQFKRLFTRDSNGVASGALRCGGSQVQLAAEFLNNSNSTVDATAQLGVFDPGLSVYQYLETFNVTLNPGLTTITKPWIPQHWVNGSMRYDLKMQWAGGAVSRSYSFDLAFDPSCAQPPSESGGVSRTESSEPASPTESSEPAAAESETPTTEPSETQTSAPPETTTAPTPEASKAAEATTAPETSSSAPVPFYTLAPTS